jgi:hypothetical protein
MKQVTLILLAALTVSMLPSMLPAQADERTREQEAADMNLKLIWGDIVLPLKLWRAPNYFRGEMEVQLEEALASLDQPMYFERFGRPYFIPGVRATVGTQRGNIIVMFEEVEGAIADSPETKAYRLPAAMREQLSNGLAKGEAFTFLTTSKSGGIHFSGVKMEIYSPYKEFPLRYHFQPQYVEEGTMSPWQLVKINRLPKQVLRFDPEDSSTDKIRSIYSDTNKYRLLPLSGFRAHDHYIDDGDYIVPPAHVKRVDTLSASPVIEPFECYDMMMSAMDDWAIEWGTMKSQRQGIYIPPDEFRESIRQPIMLSSISRKMLPVIQARISLVPSDTTPVTQVIVDGRDPSVWLALFDELPANTSLFFEDVIIEEKGVPKRVKLAFLLNIW